MKKLITPVLAASLAFGGFAMSASAQEAITGITLDDGKDFTVVKQVGQSEDLMIKGLTSSWQKVALPDTAEVIFESSNLDVAEVEYDGCEAIVNLLGEGEATITATYDGKTVTSNIVVEGANETNKVSNITVEVDENKDGIIQDNEKYIKGGDIELFSLKELGMSDADVADVLKKDPTALHALLNGLEIKNDEEGISDGYDYVKSEIEKGNIVIKSEGSYIEVLLGEKNSYTKGWQYKINDNKLKKTASIYKLKEGDTVKFEFRKFEW